MDNLLTIVYHIILPVVDYCTIGEIIYIITHIHSCYRYDEEGLITSVDWELSCNEKYNNIVCDETIVLKVVVFGACVA